jgi:hypothetical protein
MSEVCEARERRGSLRPFKSYTPPIISYPISDTPQQRRTLTVSKRNDVSCIDSDRVKHSICCYELGMVSYLDRLVDEFDESQHSYFQPFQAGFILPSAKSQRQTTI